MPSAKFLKAFREHIKGRQIVGWTHVKTKDFSGSGIRLDNGYAMLSEGISSRGLGVTIVQIVDIKNNLIIEDSWED